MKGLTLTVILIIVVHFNSLSQLKSDYARGFEVGFKEGYCYNNKNVDCFYPLTPEAPLPRINENKENYTQGYNRGFQFGLDLKRSNEALNESTNRLNQQTVRFNEYVPQNPTQAMVEVGVIKQKMYDARYEWIQKRINHLAELSTTLFNEQTLPSDYDWRSVRSNHWDRVVNYTKSIKAVDFSDNYQFSLIQNRFNELEKYFYNGYNELIIQKQNSELNSGSVSSNSKTAAKIYVYRRCGMVAALTKVKLYANGELICKIPICSGYNFTITKSGQLTLLFAGGGCFTSQEVTINVSPGQKDYYVRYDIGSTDCAYSLVSPSVGQREYRSLKKQLEISK